MNNIALKKVLRDYTYLSESLEDIKTISSVAEGEFRTALREKDEVAIKALVPPSKEAESKEEKPTEEKIEDDIKKAGHDDKKFKKLFRKIAVKCHPDKLDDSVPENVKKHLKEQYEELMIANENHDWGMLIKLSVDFDVELEDIDAEQITNIQNKIEELKFQIARYEGSMAYQWYQMQDETLKDKYLADCAEIFKKHLGL